jgi:hypothetical protein
LGAIRQVTLDNVLGALTLVTRDPLVTVKLLVFMTLFTAAWGAYGLSYDWYRNRGAAIIAGLLYMTSQASLTRWGSGELNVELVVAAAPFLLLAWGWCLERLTLRRAIAFTLLLNVVLFVRLDMAAYVLPFLLVQAVVTTLLSPRSQEVALRVLGATVFGACATTALLAYQIIPISRGLKAHWLTATVLFDPGEFEQRSVPLFPSLLGFGREIGYFAFSGEQTWFSHPWMPVLVYELAAAITVAAALWALAFHRGHRTICLVTSLLFGVFLAKGIRPPVAEPYSFAIAHLPAFGNLRDPNRWLIVPSIAVAVLAGLTATSAWRFARAHLPAQIPRPMLPAVAIALGFLALLPVGPSLVRGFLTWRVTSDQSALLNQVGRDKSEFTVATIPYDQTYRFLQQGSYRGYEHDLGAESAAFTGHPSLADGGWNQQVADFVAYTSSLLTRGNNAFARLLGTVGVKYLVQFDYPETAPHLLPARLEARHHDPAAGTFAQQRGAADLSASRVVASNTAGVVRRLPGWSPALSFRTNSALILGGRAGLAAFADLPGIHLAKWDATTADDVVASSGLEGLISEIRSSDVIVLSNETVPGLAALFAPALVAQPGITSTPALDRLTELLPSDASIRLGSARDESIASASPLTTRVVTRFVMHQRSVVDVWTKVRTNPTAARLVFRIDGRVVSRLTPLSLSSNAIVSIRVGKLVLDAGAHVLTTEAVPSAYGGTYEVAETRVISSQRLSLTKSRLERAILPQLGKIVVALDIDSLPFGLREPALYSRSTRIADGGASFWTAVGATARESTVHSEAASLRVGTSRKLYTVATHGFSKPVDWGGREFVFLRYRADAGLGQVRLLVDFDRARRRSVSFRLPSASRWRTVALNLSDATGGFTPAPSDWRHIVSLRIATDSRATTGTLQLSRMDLSPRVDALAVAQPLPCNAQLNAVARPSRLRVRLDRCRVVVEAPRREIGRHETVVLDARPVVERPTMPVRFSRVGPTSYSWSVNAPHVGSLVLNQGFDPHWTLETATRSVQAIPAFSVVNGFRLPAGGSSGTIRFEDASSVSQGTGVSAAALASLLLLALRRPSKRIQLERRSRCTRRAKRRWPTLARRAPGYWTLVSGALVIGFLTPATVVGGALAALALLALYRIQWWHCLIVATVLIGAAAVLERVSSSAADTVAFESLGVSFVALLLLVTRQRERLVDT